MRALTLWQPWASLMAVGAKRWETRSWSTSYRGPVLIHAGHAKAPRIDDPRFTEEAIQALGVADWDTLPKGAVLAVADLVDVRQVSRLDPFPAEHTVGSLYRETLFGDWSVGRYAWRFDNVSRLDAPIEARGRQRLWVPSDAVIAAVRRQVEANGPRLER